MIDFFLFLIFFNFFEKFFTYSDFKKYKNFGFLTMGSSPWFRPGILVNLAQKPPKPQKSQYWSPKTPKLIHIFPLWRGFLGKNRGSGFLIRIGSVLAFARTAESVARRAFPDPGSLRFAPLGPEKPLRVASTDARPRKSGPLARRSPSSVRSPSPLRFAPLAIGPGDRLRARFYGPRSRALRARAVD